MDRLVYDRIPLQNCIVSSPPTMCNELQTLVTHGLFLEQENKEMVD